MVVGPKTSPVERATPEPHAGSELADLKQPGYEATSAVCDITKPDLSQGALPTSLKTSPATASLDYKIPQPAATLKEVLEGLDNHDNTKLNLALHRVYPEERPYAQDFSQLVHELATRMIKAVPEEMKNLKPEDLQVHLVDRSSTNAYVIPTKSGTFHVYVHQGLVKELLEAPELAAGKLSIDALAGVIAHEICHTNFKRCYNDRGNSMLQEEYCDLLPAKMLGRAGFRPEVMSKVCDVFSRVNKLKSDEPIEIVEPHASPAIRKEIYEKGAFKEYERARRQTHVEGASNIDDLRDDWETRLHSILTSSAPHRIVSCTRHALNQQGYGEASFDKKMEILGSFLKEHQDYLKLDALSPELTLLCSDLSTHLKDLGPAGKRYVEHPTLKTLSALLYVRHDSAPATHAYCALSDSMNVKNFGVFTHTDQAIARFLTATSLEELTNALAKCEAAFAEANDHGAWPRVADSTWGGILFPLSGPLLGNTFNKQHFADLKAGETIPFPYTVHQELQNRLLQEVRNGDYKNERALNILRHYLDYSGINQACATLEKRSGHPRPFEKLDLAHSLRLGTGCGDLSAFTISQADGITMLYPSRELLPGSSKAEIDTVFKTETNYAQFITARGLPLVAEARQLTHETFLPFVAQHALLIAPQVHPYGILPADQASQSHLLASTVFTRLSELMHNDPADGFLSDTKEFLTSLQQFRWSAGWRVYQDYHNSVVKQCLGPRMDPEHPLIQYLVHNRDGLLSKEEQLLSLTALNAFHEATHRQLVNGELRTAYEQTVGGREELLKLLNIDMSQPPGLFTSNLTRLHDSGTSIYGGASMPYPEHAVKDVRAQIIFEYLTITPPERFSIHDLHELADLCASSHDRKGPREIIAIATNRTLKEGLSHLTNFEFLDHYRRLVTIGVTDQSVQITELCRQEIDRRYHALPSGTAQWEFLQGVIYPRAFRSGDEINRLGFMGDSRRHLSEQMGKIDSISSVYFLRTTDPNSEQFIIAATIRGISADIRSKTESQYDDGSDVFASACQGALATFDKRRLPPTIRSRVLEGIAEELLLQRGTSFMFRDNLNAHSKIQGHLNFAELMSISHQAPETTNAAAVGAHNGLLALRGWDRAPLRESLFRFLLDTNPNHELNTLTPLLVNELVHAGVDRPTPAVFEALGIRGLQGIARKEDFSDQQQNVLEYHLKGLHERFAALDLREKGAALSVLAVDNNPTEGDFKKFMDTLLLPRLLPAEGPYNQLLLTGINDYFQFYNNAIHHKFMVACAILASAKQDSSPKSELAQVGLVARSFLGAHGTAGYKVLQRIRNHPSTARDIKEALHDVLDDTIRLPRWKVHERLEELGPTGPRDHWVGRAKAGSMCLSVPLRKADGSESFVSIIHPGSHVDSLYWLANFTTMASNLAELEPRLGTLAPMVEQTRRLIRQETEFNESPKAQQAIAEAAYTYTMKFPHNGITVLSSCAPLISSEARPHPNDFMQDSGNKEAVRVHGRSLLELVSELHTKAGSGAWSNEQALQRFNILKTVAFSVLANEVRLAASCKGKDHDRHPGNYLIDIQEDKKTAQTTIHLRHFDFGCTDICDPSKNVVKELGATLQTVIGKIGLFKMLFTPSRVNDDIATALFDKGKIFPEIGSLPLGLLAASGAQEKVSLMGKERALLSGSDYLKLLKVALESAQIPQEISAAAPTGLKGWLSRQLFKRVDTEGVSFV